MDWYAHPDAAVEVVSHADDLQAINAWVLSLRVVMVTMLLARKRILVLAHSEQQSCRLDCVQLLWLLPRLALACCAYVKGLLVSIWTAVQQCTWANMWETINPKMVYNHTAFQYGTKFMLAMYVPCVLILWPAANALLSPAQFASKNVLVWIPVTSAMVMEFSVGSVWRRVLNRIVGTISGCTFFAFSVFCVF